MKLKEIKTLKFEIKDMDSTSGEFEGYASTFGVVDSYNDVVESGAFKKTLRENKGKVPIFYMHKTDQWIGMGLKAKEDDRGLRVSGQLDIENNQRARETFSLMRMCQELDRPAGLSIGYTAVKWEIQKREIRALREIDLWEYSPTPPKFHATPGANVTDVKSLVTYLHDKYTQFGIEPSWEDSEIELVASKGIIPVLDILIADGFALSETRAATPPNEPDIHSFNEALDQALHKLRR